MKVVLISNYWKKSLGGGVKNYLINLVNELKQREELEVRVIFRKGKDPENYGLREGKGLFSLKAWFILKKIKPDVIYSQGSWYCLLPGVLYKALNNIKLIHTFHTEPEPEDKLSFPERFFFQSLLDKCDWVTFVSKNLKKKVETIYGLNFKNSVITYAGVNCPVAVSNTEIETFRKEYKIPENSIVLLAIGLTALKHKAEGAKILIKAVSKLKTSFPETVLILTREGIYSEELKKLSREEKLQEAIIFTGTIEKPSVPLSLCNIYTHTPLGEGGVSLALLEAMAMGKPILATKAGGIPEAISDGVNGILVEPDVDAITEQLKYLLKHREIALSLGENAEKTAKERFSWGSSTDLFLKLAK